MKDDLKLSTVLRAFNEHREMMREREIELTRQGIKIFRLSATERQEFRDCRRKWDWASYSRQGLEPKKPATALSFGHGIHATLEFMYQQESVGNYIGREVVQQYWNKWVDDKLLDYAEKVPTLFGDIRQEWEHHRELGEKMLMNYRAWSLSRDHKDFAKVLSTEQEIAVYLWDYSNDQAFRFTDAHNQVWEIWLVGRIDMIVQDWDGSIWVLDHKTSKDTVKREKLLIDDQMTVYLYAVQRILYQPVAGALYNVLRKKVPSVPQLLKDGKNLSRAKIDTTYEVYLDTILSFGFDPEEYADILSFYEGRESEFFTRVRIERNANEIELIGKYLVMEAIDMLNAPYIYPNPTWMCQSFCDFSELCYAKNRGDDISAVIEFGFQKRKAEEGSVYNRESTIE